MSVISTVIADIEAEVGIIGTEIYNDLGYLGHAVYASVQYDAKKAFDAAVAAGHFAIDTFVKVGKQELADYWVTVKDQLIAAWASLKVVISTKGMGAALDAALAMLKAINWRGVGLALTGVGESTLKVSANAALQMLIAGILV